MIVVTAPTGNIGCRVMDHLLAAGAELRLVARNPAKLPDTVRGRVEVVEGSHADAAVVDRAFAGADAVFWLVQADPAARSVMDAFVGFSEPGAEALRWHGVARVVNITALGRGTRWEKEAGHVTGSLAMDDLLAATGAAFRAVACPSLMDNVARQVAAIRDTGQFVGPDDGDRKAPTCAARDVAAVSARLLLDDTWTGVGHAAVLGPEDLSFNDMAAIMSDVLGRTIRYQQIPLDTYKAGFVGRGYSDAMAQGMADMARAKNEGMDNAEPRTPESTTPASFRQWCEEELKPAVLG